MVTGIRDALRSSLRASGMKEVAFVSLGSQGLIAAADILTSALVNKKGKYVSVAVYARGERSNTPVVNMIRVAEQSTVPVCGISDTSELLVADEKMYISTAEKANEAVIGLRDGILMVCTDKEPEEVAFPYDFTGTVVTADAQMIAAKYLPDRQPPPYGTAALGMYIKATGALTLDELKDAIKERFRGKLGDANAAAAAEVFASTKIKQNVVLKGRVARPEHGYRKINLDAIQEYHHILRPRLKKFSEGNEYLWRENLPVWEEQFCTCGSECVLVDYCPEGVIRYENKVIYKEYETDYEFCKGCGICAAECKGNAAKKAVSMQNAREVYGR